MNLYVLKDSDSIKNMRKVNEPMEEIEDKSISDMIEKVEKEDE